MASIPPFTWASPPNRTSSSSSSSFSPAKPLLFPPKRLRSLKPLPLSSGDPSPEGRGESRPEAPDPVKLAFAKAAEYRKSKSSSPAPKHKLAPDPAGGAKGSSDPSPEVPDSATVSMEKPLDYKKKKGIGDLSVEEPTYSGQEKMNASNSREGFVENKVSKKEELKISSTDFLGLDFSEKRYRGTPPGLVPVMDPFLNGELPEVEIIVGDANKFEVTTPKTISNEDYDSEDLYKPKVSTWGVFPRPSNVSKTFGGGRVIRPGEVLETSETKAAKEKRSRELITAYKTKMGMSIDAKTKAECEKALKEGDELMDLGKLREALPFYEKVMKDLVFQRGGLKKMFLSEEWATSKFAKMDEGKETEKTMTDVSFWRKLEQIHKTVQPLVYVLKLVDGDAPTMGVLYDEMDKAKIAIANAHDNNQAKYQKYWDVIDERWNSTLHSPLHAAGYFLNLAIRYRHDVSTHPEIRRGLQQVIGRIEPDLNDQLDAINQSELHGLAALQWAICQDSLRSPTEAKVIYEKLQSHPNAQVSKKARQFVYSFQAMEMMKMTSSSYSRKTGYENYFEAFVENKVDYTPKEEEQDEGALKQSLPYIMLLLSPIFVVVFIAVRKSYQF